MTNIEVKEILKKHLDNITFVKLLLLDVENMDEYILEALALPAVVLSEIPKSVTNKITSVTENIALNYTKTNNEIFREINKLNREIERVEIALKRLLPMERLLIENKFVYDLTWRDVGNLFTRQYYYISDKSMRQKTKRAIIKLSKFLAL